MNALGLLEHFDRLIDTPDAVPRLRRFILDLAVRGKLVEQNPKDEPAGELLKRIAVERTSDLRCRRNGRTSDLVPIDEIPFELPHSWEWARLGELGHTQTGTTPSKADKSFFGRHLPFIKPGDLLPNRVDYENEGLSESGFQETGRLAPAGSLLMVCIGTVGKCQVIDRDCSFNQQINSLAPSRGISPRYVFHAVSSKYFQDAAIADSSRTTIAILNKGKWEQLLFPVPPLAEQHRVVAKVDELMALCDELETAQTKREKRRDRLVAATLHGLNNGDATPTPGTRSTFEENARFYFNHLPCLTTRPKHIHQLRQTILNLAVRGKLVPQDPNDQPASQLIDEIRKDKRTLIGHGSIRKGRPLQELEDSAFFFDLPKGWSWVRLGELAKMVTSGSRDWAQHYSAQGAIFVRMGNLSRGSYQLRLNHLQRVKPPDDTEGARTKLEEGDLLVSITGEAGLLGLIPANFGEAYINQHTCLVRPMPQLKNRYLPELFRSPFAQDQFNEPQRGIKNSLRLTDVTEFLVPLPPLAEQHRIVAKVDELIALCDELEARIASVTYTNGQLLKVVLEEALPAGKTPIIGMKDSSRQVAYS